MSEELTDRIAEKLADYCDENGIELTEENYDEILRLAVTPEEYAACSIPEETHGEIDDLCAQGDECAERGEYAQALNYYWRAWDLVPEPQAEYEAATWILAAIGDANFLSGDFVSGRDNLSNAMHCPHGAGNPFLHLRLGQCQFELGDLDRAAVDRLIAKHSPEAALEGIDRQRMILFGGIGTTIAGSVICLLGYGLARGVGIGIIVYGIPIAGIAMICRSTSQMKRLRAILQQTGEDPETPA